MKSFAVILLSLVLTCAAFAVPKSALNTTHRLQVTKDTGIAICSTTAVGKHTLLTAAHCDSPSGVVMVDGELAVITGKVFDGNDHELMIVDKTFRHFARFAETKVKIGQRVWIRGNPKGIPNMLREGIFSGSFKVTAPVPGIMDGVYFIHMYNLNSTGGDSGAAVFNNNGEIVDVVSVSYLDENFHLMGAFELNFKETDLAKIK